MHLFMVHEQECWFHGVVWKLDAPVWRNDKWGVDGRVCERNLAEGGGGEGAVMHCESLGMQAQVQV